MLQNPYNILKTISSQLVFIKEFYICVCVWGGGGEGNDFFNYSRNINLYIFLNVNCKGVKGIELNLFFHFTSFKYVNHTRAEHTDVFDFEERKKGV